MSLREKPLEAELEVITTLSNSVIQASAYEKERQEELTRALRFALSNGVSIDDLSEASGLAPSTISARLKA